MQSNEPDLINSQLILNLPAYKGSSAQLSSKQIPIPESFCVVVVGAMVGELVEILMGSGSAAVSVQSPQAIGHAILSSSVSDGLNPRAVNPSQLRPACRIVSHVEPILDLYEVSSRHCPLLGIPVPALNEFGNLTEGSFADCTKFGVMSYVSL